MKRFCVALLMILLAGGALAAPLRLFLVGDSTCATKELKGENPERGWGQLFPPLFDSLVVVENHAMNGRSSRSFRAEGRWDKVLDGLHAGDYVFIQFGHNDQKTNTERYADPATYAENLRRYVREVRERGAQPLLLTPIVRRHFVEGTLTDTHGEYPDAVRRIATEERVPFVDAQRLTEAWVSALGDISSRDYFMWVAPGTCPLMPEGRQDDTHLNARGARVVARLIAGALAEQLPALAQHLRIPDLVVAQDGSGDFFTVSDAVAAIPDFGRDTTRVVICGGVYREKVSIPATKRRVRLEGRGDVQILWDDYATRNGLTGKALGTSGSATVYFGGEGWTISDITFGNTAGRVGQAVAVQCLATELHFIRCRFLGDQDTLYLYGVGNRDGETVAENARIAFTDCYIEGTTDFIFGSAAALFLRCEIRSKADSYITAASTCRGQACGLIFVECRLTADPGVTRCYLGRPWREYAQTVFVDCQLGAHILPAGWHDWGKPAAHTTTRYAESGSRGAGADVTQRVTWAHRPTRKEVERIVASFYE